ncbi:MAG: hypothetical protein EBT60_02185 [Bacteroidetes bacterium]|nr:hypothetical protein [Bacteroidota bacterium]
MFVVITNSQFHGIPGDDVFTVYGFWLVFQGDFLKSPWRMYLEGPYRSLETEGVFQKGKAGLIIDLQSYLIWICTGVNDPVEFEGLLSEVDVDIDTWIEIFQGDFSCRTH